MKGERMRKGEKVAKEDMGENAKKARVERRGPRRKGRGFTRASVELQNTHFRKADFSKGIH